MRSSIHSLLIVAALASASAGCIKTMVLNGTIESTRKASTALDGVGDLELVRTAAQSGLVQFEGMHKLAPDNTDALFMLTKAWVSYGFGFCEDDIEVAHDAGDTVAETHHTERASHSYARAVKYGLELLAHHAGDFEAAKKGDAPLRAWLKNNFSSEEDGGDLFWVGYAWLARTSLGKDDPALVAELWVGIAMLERSVELAPTYNHYAGTIALAAYHARSASAELDESKKIFDTVLEKTQRKSLIVQLNYATRYACAKQDPALYEKLLSEVLSATDAEPELLLTNTIARRRAKRWLGEKRMFEQCSMDPMPKSQAEAPAVTPPSSAKPAPGASAPVPPKAATPPAKAPAPAPAGKK
jgi:hypothetical protein